MGEGETQVWAPLFLTPPPHPAFRLFCSWRVLCYALCSKVVEEGLGNGWREEQQGGEATESAGKRGRLREALFAEWVSWVEDIWW